MTAVQTFLSQLKPEARHLFSGNVCGLSKTHYTGQVGYLHFFRGGKLTVMPEGAEPFVLEKPSLIFYPTSWPHHMFGDELLQAKMLCSVVEFCGPAALAARHTLPRVIVMDLENAPNLQLTLEMLVREADAKRTGWQAATDRLFEYLIAQIIREIVENGTVDAKVLEGMGDKQLAKGLTAIHSQLEKPWSLEDLAAQCGMSRARFAARFLEVLGTTPMHYLSVCRLNNAAQLIKVGHSMKAAAAKSGFSSASIFARAFFRQYGQSPSEWLKQMSA